MRIANTRARWIPAALLGAVSLVLMGANDDCGPSTGEGPGIEQDLECQAAADCEAFQAPADCEGGWSCEQNLCKWFCDGDTACASDADCGDGTCVDGACQSVTPEEVCASQDDCGQGQLCVNGLCTDDGEPDACQATGCSGEICAAGPVDSPCISAPWHECLKYTVCGEFGAGGACGWAKTEAFQECMEKYEEPPVQCQTDADCGPGMRCELEPCPPCGCPPDAEGCVCAPCLPQGTCVPDEEPPPECAPTGCSAEVCAAETVYSTCEYEPWFECLEHTKCGAYGAGGTCGWAQTPAFQECMEQLEQPPVQCEADDDCPAGQKCACTSDPACPECDVCYFQCVPDDSAGECLADSDCGAGMVCNTWDHCLAPPDGPGSFSALCYGLCEPKEPEWECQSDADCGPGDYCDIQMCADCACPAGDPECAGCGCFGTCQPKEPEYCSSDADCPEGFHCECAAYPSPYEGDGDASEPIAPPCPTVCVPDEPPAEGCWSDAECGDGMVCDKDDSCEAPADCYPQPTPDGSCADLAGVDFGPCAMVLGWAVVNGQCVSVSGCSPGNHEFFGGPEECEQACLGGGCEPVCYGKCVPKEPTGECLTDADCGEGAYCEIQMCPDCWCPYDDPSCTCPPCTGVCVSDPDPPPSEACMDDADCADGMVCDPSACPPPPYCEPGQTCPDVCYGQCVPAPPPSDECSSDADCADGAYCEIQVCADCACPDGSYDCECPEPSCWGVCKEKAPEPTSCLADSDCPAGQVCHEQPCPMMPCTPDYCPPCYGVCGEPDPAPEPTACMVTGCSGTVCAAEPVYTTCEYQPWYVCYQYAECGAQADGACGWHKTDAFTDCMNQFAP